MPGATLTPRAALEWRPVPPVFSLETHAATNLSLMTAGTVSVLIVEDHQMVAAGLAAILEDEPDITVVGRAATVAKAVSMASALRPDVVLMDYRLPDARGGEGISAVLQASPSSRVLTVTASREEEALSQVVSAGAMGFISKDAPGEVLVSAVSSVARGEAHFSRAAMASIVQGQRTSPEGSTLSAREVEVLQSLADGRSVVQIAADLHLSQHTVRNHIRSAMARLGVHTSLEAVVRAARAGLVDIAGPER
jgi:DNA-binding NarL/FixJ family response regulator